MAKKTKKPPHKRKGRGAETSAVSLSRDLRRKLWDYFQSVGHRPVGVSEVGRALQLSQDSQRKVRRFLKQEEREGNLTAFRGGRFLLKTELVDSPVNIWDKQTSKARSKNTNMYGSVRKNNDHEGSGTQRGILHMHPNGFGFVQREGEESLFVPPHAINGAIHGDEVVTVEQWDANKGKSAKIIQIARPFSGRLVGQIYQQKGQLFLRPDNDRYSDLPAVWQGKRENGEPGQWAVGEVCRSDWDPYHIWVEIERWLPAQEGPALDRARSAAVLEADVFPQAVLEEAEAAAIQPTPEDWEGRLDLRDFPLFTIDGADARDFDDAVGIEFLNNGLRRIIVAIADVTHYVKEDTALDEEALRRGTSVYFPASCLPMLPEALSNNICSLRPHEDRMVMAAIMDYDGKGQRVNVSLEAAVMNSHARFTYEQVAELIDNPDGLDTEHPTHEMRESILALNALARQLRASRMQRGSIDLDVPEPYVVLDEEGEIADIRRSPRHASNQLIEELMLQANESVATFFQEHNIPGIYRIHEEPNPEKMQTYFELLERLGLRNKLLGSESSSSQSDLWDLDPRFFGRVLEQIEGHPAQRLLNQMLLRSMKQAAYQSENTGHFGLGLENYLHFTSPIRRYPDLIVHRMLKRYLDGDLPRQGKQRKDLDKQMEDVGAHCSTRERMAMKAEREVLARYRARFMQQHVGEEFDGIVTAIAPFGMFVEIDTFFIEGLIHMRNLPGDYHFDEHLMALVGPRSGHTFNLGDQVRIVVEEASPLRGEIDFSLITTL